MSLVQSQGGALDVNDAMTAAANRLDKVERDTRDDPYVVIIDGARRKIKNKGTWATIGAAKGAVHRFLHGVRIYGRLAARPTRDERATWIAERCRFMRLSQWRAKK